MEYSKDFTIFKPNQKGTGGALSLSLSKGGLFLTVARQLEGVERRFDWKNKIIINIDAEDVAKIASLVRDKYELVDGKTPKSASIMHSPKEGAYKTLSIIWSKTDSYKGYYLSLSFKVGESTGRAGLPLTEAEAITFAGLCNYALPKILRWDQVQCVESQKEIEARERRENKKKEESNDLPIIDADADIIGDLAQTPSSSDEIGDLTEIPF